MNETHLQSLSLSSFLHLASKRDFFPLSKSPPGFSEHCECMARAGSWWNHCSALIQDEFFILCTYSLGTAWPILACKDSISFFFFSVSFHPWAPVAHGREVFSCPQHMHGSRAAAGFWEQALGSAPLYSWLLPCLFFQEDPVRADVVLPHAQRHLSVRTWPGARSSVPSQELLCSVAHVSWSYHCRTPCG